MKNEYEPLDDYERDLIESIENNEFEIVSLTAEEIQKYRIAAENTGKKNTRMNIRMSSVDMIKLKAKALEEGIPYQTLVSSILHKYVNNRLHEAS